MPDSFHIDSPAQIQQNIQRFCEQAHAAFLASVNQIGEIVADDLKERLSRPWPPSSKADQNPARRTGALQDGIQFIVVDGPDGPEANIHSSREGDNPNVPAELEFGAAFLAPRNYMSRAMEYWEASGGDWIIDIVLPNISHVTR